MYAVPRCFQQLTLLPNQPINISSPSYPDNYPNDEECLWIVSKSNITDEEEEVDTATTTKDTGSTGSIVLIFNDFLTERTHDVVSVGHGDVYLTNTILDLSGDWVPEAVISYDTSVWVRFEADDVVPYRGFQAVVEWLPFHGKYIAIGKGKIPSQMGNKLFLILRPTTQQA